MNVGPAVPEGSEADKDADRNTPVLRPVEQLDTDLAESTTKLLKDLGGVLKGSESFSDYTQQPADGPTQLPEKLCCVNEDKLRTAFQFTEFLTAPFRLTSRQAPLHSGAYAVFHSKVVMWMDISINPKEMPKATILGVANDDSKLCLSSDGRAMAIAARDNTISVFREGKLFHKFLVRSTQFPDEVCLHQLYPTLEEGTEYSLVFSIRGSAYHAVVGGVYRCEKLPIDYRLGLAVAMAPRQEIIWSIVKSSSVKSSVYSMDSVSTKVSPLISNVLEATTTNGQPVVRIDLGNARTTKNVQLMVDQEGNAIVISRLDQSVDTGPMIKSVVNFAQYSVKTMDLTWSTEWKLNSTQIVHPRFLLKDDALVAHTRLMTSEIKSHSSHYATIYPLSSPKELAINVYQEFKPVWIVLDVASQIISLLSFNSYFASHSSQQIPLLKRELPPPAPNPKLTAVNAAAGASMEAKFVQVEPSLLPVVASNLAAAAQSSARRRKAGSSTAAAAPAAVQPVSAAPPVSMSAPVATSTKSSLKQAAPSKTSRRSVKFNEAQISDAQRALNGAAVGDQEDGEEQDD